MSSPTVPWWRTDLGEAEIAGVTTAIRERHINYGPVCRDLEKRIGERLGVPYVALVSSGSAALAAALLAVGVKAGDEVIVPACTYIATAHAVKLLGASVRVVDTLPDRPILDPAQIPPAITERTKALLPVHLNGAACDLDAIQRIARAHGLAVIEDTAQGFCSRSAAGYLGTQGDAGTFSMSIAKLITTGEGGFVATRDAKLHEGLLRARNQGVLVVADNVFDAFGFNFRLNDMLGAVGHAQMDRLDTKVRSVCDLYRTYRDALADLPYLQLMPIRVDDGEVPLWAQVRCEQRDTVMRLLEERGIQTRALNPPLSASPHLASPGPFPNAERHARTVLTLPSGPDQDPGDVQRVVEVLREIRGEVE